MSSDKPAVRPVDSDSIPDALKDLTRWVGWRWTNRNGRWGKLPINVRTCGNASSTNPATWTTFAEAIDAECDGVGVVLGDGLAGVDLDDCRRDGELTPLARSIVARLATYTEVSPTGTGVKLLCFAELPGRGSKSAAGDVEMYDHGRFFVVTGQRVDGTPATVEDRRAELAAVWREYIGAKASVVPTLGGNVDAAALNDMLRHVAKPTENDGSKRLLCVACRAVEHDLADDVAIATIRAYEVSQPFPVSWSDSDIIARLRDAEAKAERGAAMRMIDTSVRDLAIITPRAWRALQLANQPEFLFRYADAASRIERGDRNDLLIKRLNASQMRHHLAGAAKWIKYEKTRQVFVAPPRDVVEDRPSDPRPAAADFRSDHRNAHVRARWIAPDNRRLQPRKPDILWSDRRAGDTRRARAADV
ncbi:MAG: hypothetical protein IT424_05945 [Pirellulales bacterium]|nr:hypothetical protein [Pirellulales bacterium]